MITNCTFKKPTIILKIPVIKKCKNPQLQAVIKEEIIRV